MVSPSLAGAPQDIVLSVAEHLDTAMLCQLRLLSRGFNNRISPVALRNIAFHICNGEDRHLTVKTDSYYVRDLDKAEIPRLYRAIERFETLQSFEIKWHFGWDGAELKQFVEEMQGHIAEAVLKATGGVLSKLVIRGQVRAESEFAFLNELRRFNGLRVLKIGFGTYGWGCSGLDRWGQRASWYEETEPHKCVPQLYKDAVKDLIGNSPGLQELEIKAHCAIDFFDADKIFLGVFDDASGSDRTRRPKLELRSLAITGTAGTKLKTLTTHQVSLPLATYLASYSGLRHLIINDIEDLPPCVDPKVTTAFFHDALPQHAASLTELCITFKPAIDYLDGWSFDPALWAPALLSLEALESLRLYPGNKKARRMERTIAMDNAYETNRNVDGDANSGETEEEDDEHLTLLRNYQEVLDHVGSLPSLGTLGITWPGRNFGCGTGTWRWGMRSAATVSRVADKLKSNNGVPRVLVLFCGTYDVKGDEHGSELEGGWNYVRREEVDGEEEDDED
ncbi:hypothetical protein AX16_001151 [Volvariella volvacea WC 439]|nr:hypothetical protein AX16_001151 [Volvariella volvacea WC 439]